MANSPGQNPAYTPVSTHLAGFDHEVTAPLGGLAPGFAGERTLTSIFGLTLAIWAAMEIRQALRRRTGATNEDRGSRLVVQLCACAGVLLAAAARRANATAFPHDAITFSISMALIWAGVGLRWWSFRTLGHYFTFNVMTSADQAVVTAGP
jgi:protein-S-isoprenylcysteine O-methyltransferase Ste14